VPELPICIEVAIHQAIKLHNAVLKKDGKPIEL